MNPNTIKGLKIGWELAKTRINPDNKLQCPVCSTEFLRRGTRKKQTETPCCSRVCRGKFSQCKPGGGGPKKSGQYIPCAVCSKKFYRFPGDTKRKYCSILCRDSDPNRHDTIRGSNHYGWKGGITPKNQTQRKGAEYAEWRKSVFQRDAYTCQKCSYKGKGLHAHHIKGWADHPELRFDINNGQTLCVKCHSTIHNRNFYR